MKFLNWLFFISMLFTTIILTGCGSSDNETPPSPEPSKLERIEIVASPVVTKGASTLTLATGNKQAFIATAHYADGSVQDVTDSVTWATSSSSVATIDPAGLLTGIGPGVASVTASKDGIISNTLDITVTTATITSIQVTPATALVANGQTQQLAAIATYSDNTTADVSSDVIWTSDDSDVATVAPTGLLTGSGVGTTNITASKDGITSNTANVTVSAASITTIQVTPVSVSVAKGQTQPLSAMATYSDNTTADVSSTVDWISVDSGVATVSPAGLLTGIGVGTTSVTASKDGITSKAADVTVSAASITAIQVTPASVSVGKGQTRQLVAMATYSDDTTADVSSTVAWISADSNVATVTPAGLLTGIDVGTTSVTASKDGITSKAADVAVSAASITEIQVTPSSVSVIKEQTQQLVAMATYSDNTTADVSDSVAWLSSDTGIATVTTEGVLTGIEAGATSVMASKDGIDSNSVSVNVASAWVTVSGTDFSIPDGTYRDWNGAEAYCAGLSFGCGAWRLATVDELHTLYNAYPDGQIVSVLGWPGDYYWSSIIDGTGHFTVDMHNGSDGAMGDSLMNYPATCVR